MQYTNPKTTGTTNFYMSQITFEGQSILHKPNENLLKCLIRANSKPPYSCRAGLCHSCLLQSISGSIPANAQTGLTESQRKQRLLLACQCQPDGDMEIRRPLKEHSKTDAVICSLKALNPDIMELQLSPQTPVRYHAGQHIGGWRGSDIQRRYSLASVPGIDSELHLHIQLLKGGQFSEWAHHSARVGDIIKISAPQGDCFYHPSFGRRPLLLIGSRSGLGPLYGILRDALGQQHKAPIVLFHRGNTDQELYLQQELKQLASRHNNFSYRPIIGDDNNLQEAINSTLTKPDSLRMQAFICGSPSLVQNVNQLLLENSVPETKILADSFSPFIR